MLRPCGIHDRTGKASEATGGGQDTISVSKVELKLWFLRIYSLLTMQVTSSGRDITFLIKRARLAGSPLGMIGVAEQDTDVVELGAVGCEHCDDAGRIRIRVTCSDLVINHAWVECSSYPGITLKCEIIFPLNPPHSVNIINKWIVRDNIYWKR